MRWQWGHTTACLWLFKRALISRGRFSTARQPVFLTCRRRAFHPPSHPKCLSDFSNSARAYLKQMSAVQSGGTLRNNKRGQVLEVASHFSTPSARAIKHKWQRWEVERGREEKKKEIVMSKGQWDVRACQRGMKVSYFPRVQVLAPVGGCIPEDWPESLCLSEGRQLCQELFGPSVHYCRPQFMQD